MSLDLDRVRELLLPLQTSGNGETVPSDIVVPTALRGSRLVNPRPVPLIANPFTDFNQATNNWRNGDFSPVAGGAANPVNRTFTAERDNLELFGMVKFDFEENYDAFPVRGNFGLRYIETDLAGITEFGPEEEGRGSYKEWLPSANIIANLRENVVVNFAYYKTFEAFNLAEFQPLPSTVTVTEPEPDDTDEEVRSGRINIVGSGLRLEPRSSQAFDLGIAWYNRPGSIVGLNYFTKEVIGTIERRTTGGVSNPFCTLPLDELAADNPDVARAIGSGTPFNDSQGRCRLDIGLEDRENPALNVSRFINAEPVRVNGLEFQATQNTDFLDGFWGNFGGTFNYSYVESGTDEVRLPGVSKHSYNLIGYYEDEKFSVRLAQNYRSRADLESGGTFFGGARQTKARTQYDVSLTYNPRKSTQIRLQGFNLTNVIREEFQLLEALPRRRDFDGRTVTLSVQQRF